MNLRNILWIPALVLLALLSLSPLTHAADDNLAGYIGCGVINLDEDTFKIYDLMEGSPAAKAGLKNGDKVVAVDGQLVREREEGVGGAATGTVVKLTVLKDGAEQVIPVTRVSFLEIYDAPAKKGDLAAQAWMAWYYSSEYTPKEDLNYAKAKEWFHQAAEQGNNFAQYYLATLYLKGSAGFPQSNTEALKWARAALATEPGSKRCKALVAQIEALNKS